MVVLTLALALPLLFTSGQQAHGMAFITNNCPAGDISVGLYGGSVSNGLVTGGDFLDNALGFCVQVIAVTDWQLMTVAEFQLFDVLWIGNDDCTGTSAADFAAANATVAVWEAAIDPTAVMIAGGDYDFHYDAMQANAIAVTQALVTTVSAGSAPGLILQAGCYSTRGAPWFQNLGGSFTGLGHGNISGDPVAADVNAAHPFNTANGFDNADYTFGSACHGAISIAAGSAVESYNLQTLFEVRGSPCFMMSDPSMPPTFAGDIGGVIWCDDNPANGVPDAGEELGGVTVELFDASAVLIATTMTLNDGPFLFAAQALGSYSVVVDTSTLPSSCNSGAVDPDGVLDALSSVTIAIGSLDHLDQDFGFVDGVAPPPPTVTAVSTPVPTPLPTVVPMPESLTIDKVVVGFPSPLPFTFLVSPDVDGCSLAQRLEIAGGGGQIGAAVLEESTTTGAACTYTVTEERTANYEAEVLSFAGVAPDGFVRFVNHWTPPASPEQPTELAYTGSQDAKTAGLAVLLVGMGLSFLAHGRLSRPDEDSGMSA